jgi:hypothetical protein
MRPETLVIWRKRLGIRQKALGFCPPAIYAEGMYFEHPYPANAGYEMVLGFAPGSEGGGVQVCISVFGEQRSRD